jgi:protein-L-isoaspartate(D-aspartate) O-methyltransferase
MRPAILERHLDLSGLNLEGKRANMMEYQIRARGVKDPRVLEAMGKVPRHVFVPPGYVDAAYDDRPLPIGSGQTISQPYMVAVMTEALKLQGGERVLEIGTGSGYQTAVLAELVSHVVTVERMPELSSSAVRTVGALGYANVEFVVGDGTKGYPPRAPYGGILVTAGAPDIPDVLLRQLAEGGRLLIPVGNTLQQTLTRVTRTGKDYRTERLEGCVFVPLIGEYGWSENGEQAS